VDSLHDRGTIITRIGSISVTVGPPTSERSTQSVPHESTRNHGISGGCSRAAHHRRPDHQASIETGPTRIFAPCRGHSLVEGPSQRRSRRPRGPAPPVGDVRRFARPEQLTCRAGLTPKHHESDKHVHRGRITKQGSRLVRWAAIESVQILPKTSVVGRIRDRVGDRRGRNIGVVAAARRATRTRLLRPVP
jgi:hypothetical protein